jgi:ATP-binding cassette, subfamily B, bacterial MsbA
METTPTARRVVALARPYLAPLVLASAVVTLEAGVSLLVPRIAGVAVDTVIDGVDAARSLARLDLVVLILVGLFAVRGFLGFAQSYLVRATGARFLRDLRERVYGHLIRLAPDFYEERRVGELLSRISSDLGRVQGTLTYQIPIGIRASLTFAGTLAILFTMHARLTLVALLIVPPVTIFSRLYGKRLQRVARRVQDSLADTSAAAEETLSGIAAVQANAGEEVERGRYRAGLERLLGLRLESARLTSVFYGLISFVGFTAFALILWYGGRLILRDELSPGELTAFLLYAFVIAGSVESLGSLYAGLRELRGASHRVFEILDTRPTIADAPGARDLERAKGAVTVRDVSFRYPAQEPGRFALEDLTLEIAPGEVVALVGPSGAGKSTLFSLLLRFRDPTAGRIALDGSDLRELTLASLRGAIALVPQEIFLFGGTVADNIRFGRPAAGDAEVREAARAAGADEFVHDLPRGYDTIVGERGVKLSAGQRQRIAIARAFLRRPALLLLDEATSALDADSEARVQTALPALMSGRTTLIIAHRLATARRADRILVLDRGRVLASGSHEDLLESSPLYRRYWELQAGPGGP